MKYELYSSIEHGNVTEQQMPGIHVQNQIYKYSHDIEFTVWVYIVSVVCVALHNTIM